jgi:microcystin-dependent protein
VALRSALSEGLHGIGDLKPYGGDIATLTGKQEPELGWLLCNGAVVATSDYPRLSNKIGTAYNIGGEGAGNFRLPDFRDRHALPNGTGTTRGASFGAIAHKHSATHVHDMSHTHSLQAHVHSLQGHGHTVTFGPAATETGVQNVAGGSHVAVPAHSHFHANDASGGPSNANTGGPSIASTGDTATANTGSDLRASDLAGQALTDGKDAPYLVVGAQLIRY